MIIDTHAQLYTRGFIDQVQAGRIPGLENLGYAGFMAKSPPSDTLTDMDEAGVDLSVVVGVDAETNAGFRVPNELVAKEVDASEGRLIGFMGLDPRKGNAAIDELRRSHDELGLRGIKFICHLNELEPSHRLFYPIYEEASARGLPVLHHTGTHYHAGRKIKYCQPLFIDEIAVDFPKLKLVAAHFGWPWTDEAIAVALRNRNVYLNVAGWAPRHWPEVLLRYLRGPLQRKVLFGSDHPLLPRKRLVNEIDKLELSDEIKTRLFEHNPKELLGL
ncbi:MAG: amidohydrolase family protein [Candidatus Alcyoniella australis]|nr:amidohydrolase family protein [Candidatus Alcyoniella australis]